MYRQEGQRKPLIPSKLKQTMLKLLHDAVGHVDAYEIIGLVKEKILLVKLEAVLFTSGIL